MTLRTVEFEISDVAPKTTHHSKKIITVNGHGSMADTPKLRTAKRFWREALKPHIPNTPFLAPVRLSVALVWPFRASDPKRVSEAGVLVPCTAKPDLTNITKTIEDILVELGFIENDQGNSSLIVNKYWGSDPYIYVCLEEMDSLMRGRK